MQPDAWGELAPGPYAVGFSTTFATGFARVNGPRDSALGAHRAFRPVLIATWYPATSTEATPVPMTYGEYLAVAADKPGYASFAERQANYVRQATIEYATGQKPDALDAVGSRLLADLERLEVRAMRDARPAGGQFPVVFYHPGLGGSYEDNSVLCEYLASHGYLVLTSGYQKEDGPDLNLNGDRDRSIKDLSFLMNRIAAPPNADMTRIEGAGQSYGAQALKAWSSEVNTPVMAVVILDSTVEYVAPDHPGFALLRKQLSRVDNIRAAWMLFAVKSRKPNWQQWDDVTGTAIWLGETGDLGHDDFLSQGLLGTILRSDDAGKAALIRKRYDAVG